MPFHFSPVHTFSTVLAECNHNEFHCNSGLCIDKKKQCNGQVDCSDESDEVGCVSSQCSLDQFMCNNNTCLNLHKVCDGTFDCQDGSDEQECESKLSVMCVSVSFIYFTNIYLNEKPHSNS